MIADASGHRSVPHTADLRIEAWAPTREECIAQAVLGTVESFLDTSTAARRRARRRRLMAPSDADLLVAVLEEVIYLLDTDAEVPVDLEVERVDGGVDVAFSMTGVNGLPQIGAAPKAVSLHELSLVCEDDRWRCSVTLDV